MMTMKRMGLLAFGVLAATLLPAETVWISSDDDLRDINVGPGDEVIWQDGTYYDQRINFNFSGSAEAPVVLRAETPGGVILKGESFVKFGGDYITVSGFHFYNGDDYYREVGSSVVQFRSNNGNRHAHHCRLTECAIIDMNSWEQDVDDDDDDGNTTELIFHSSKWIQIYGTNNRVDHCYFAQKKVRGALIIAEMVPQDGESGTPYESFNHRIDHNFFGPNPVGWASNEFETIRLGTSDYSNFNGNMVVENNYFYKCDGEIEVISNKSSNNTYRNNILIACQGSLVIRHGDGCTVSGNIIMGKGISSTGGIRLNGENHTVINNYVSGTRGDDLRAALVLRCAGGVTGEDEDGGYEQVRNALIAFNTFYDNTQSMNLGELGGKDNNYPPTQSKIANNIVVSTRGTLVSWGRAPTSMTYEGNLLYGSSLGINSPGFIESDPELELNGFGMMSPGASSPALGASIGSYINILEDIDGESRPISNADVGADEVSPSGHPLAPMNPASVGPGWIRVDAPVEMVSVGLSPLEQLIFRFKQEGAVGLGAFGLQALDSEHDNEWKARPVLVDGPDGDGVYRCTVDVAGGSTHLWRVVNQ